MPLPTRHLRPGALLLLVSLLLSAGPARAAKPTEVPTPAQQLDAELRHAWTAFWLALAEQGDTIPLDAGLAHVARAQGALQRATTLTETERATKIAHLAQVHEALTQQRELALGSLRGRFGMTAFLGQSLLVDPDALRTHELVDDPDTVVIQRVTEALRDQINAQWMIHPQHDVVVLTTPRNAQLEQKAIFSLASAPRFNVRTLGELADRLPAPALAQTLGAPKQADADALARALGVERLIVLVLERVDRVGEVTMFALEARLGRRDARAGEAMPRISVQGVIRDRRPRATWLLLTLLGLLLVGVLGLGV